MCIKFNSSATELQGTIYSNEEKNTFTQGTHLTTKQQQQTASMHNRITEFKNDILRHQNMKLIYSHGKS